MQTGRAGGGAAGGRAGIVPPWEEGSVGPVAPSAWHPWHSLLVAGWSPVSPPGTCVAPMS